MATTSIVKRKIQVWRNSLAAIGEDSVEATKGTVIQLNQEQMLKGQKGNGGRLGTYKSASYAIKKFSMNNLAGFGNKDYKLTGAFYRGFFAATDAGKLILGSNDPKSSFLDQDGLFGLTPESKVKYNPILKKEFIIQSKIKLNG